MHDRFAREAEAGEVEQSAAADVVDDWQVVLLAQGDEVGKRDAFREAGDAIVAGVDLHQSGRVRL